MTTLVPLLAFWFCVGLIAYAYVLYPLLVWCASRGFGRAPSAPALDSPHPPMVSLLISAYNEEAVIEARIHNALAIDYDPGRLEIVIVSDGSTDATAEIVRRYRDRGIRLIEIAERRGKAAALNRAFPELAGEIVVLSDANTEFQDDVVLRLARWFGDPAVGVVCGRLDLVDPRTGHNVDGLYWRAEKFLKACEARIGALLGANGAVYAIRRSDYSPPPDDTIVEDLVIPLLARLRRDCSILYDETAVGREETAPDVREEFRRRCRISAGDFQSIPLLWPLLDPRRGTIAWVFLSHKLLRWSGPFLLLGILASSFLLMGQPLYQLAFYLQMSILALSLSTLAAPRRVRLPTLLRLTAMFVGMNVALLVGFERWLRGASRGGWESTARPTAGSGPG